MIEDKLPYDAPIPIGDQTIEEIEEDIKRLEEEPAKLTEWPDTGHY